MGHRKTKSGVVENPVNENWVHGDTLQEWKKAALKQVEIRKQYEKTHQLKAVRVDNKTVILKEVK